MSVRLLKLAMCVALFCGVGLAQDWSVVNFGAGAGFTTPVDRAGKRLNTGWNINLRGGLNLNPHIAADLDYTYQRSSLNDATLALFNEPDGTVSTWSLTFNPVLNFAPKARIRPYATAGYGLYHRDLTLTRPSTVATLVCDPFFGFCTPALVGVNQVVASNDTYKAGWNAGGGFDIPLGEHRAKLFVEARYHRMFTNHGDDFTLVPVTFGVHF